MAREFFKNLPNTSTPLTAERLNGLLDGEEAMGNLVVDSIRSKNIFGTNDYRALNLTFYRPGSVSYEPRQIEITSNGAVSSGLYGKLFALANIDSNKTYTLSFYVKADATIDFMYGVAGDRPTETIGTSYERISYTRQGSALIDASFAFYCMSERVSIINIKDIQLEEGDEPTSFTPYDTYSNKALKNEDVVVGSIRSKNLFNKRNVATSFRIGPNGDPYRDSSYNLSEYIEVKPSVSYTYSRYTSGGGSAAVAFYDSNKTFISRTMWSSYINDSSIIFQTTSSTKYIRICELGTLLDNMQLEEGNVFTPYSPYQSLNYEDIFIKKGSNTSTGTGLRIWFTRPGQQFFIFGKSYINSSDKFWEYHIGLNNAGIPSAGNATYNDISNNLGVAPSLNNDKLYFDLMCGSYTQVLIISADYFDVNAI